MVMGLRQTAFRDPRSYFRQYADLDDAEAEATARSIWRRINLVNLHENILPTRPRADLLLDGTMARLLKPVLSCMSALVAEVEGRTSGMGNDSLGG